MGWESVVEEADRLGCWVRYLGVDATRRHHACAGPRSLLLRLAETSTTGDEPLDPERLPFRAILDLELPLGAGDDPTEAGQAALSALVERAPHPDEEPGAFSSE